jgi:hypothetical protein
MGARFGSIHVRVDASVVLVIDAASLMTIFLGKRRACPYDDSLFP